MNKELSANTTLSHYRVISKIGEGGMGEVWLAEDTRLGRKVALKLLPAEFTEDSERVRRFTLEAKAASALNHPNIIAVYDIGESDTGRFIVMEFVTGNTLRSVIAKDNSLETFFTLGAQMAKALSAAHAAGITHRDIKPDNIMVRDDGYVKMLDFGLARLLPTTASDPEAATLAQQTTPGTVMGTLAYMSPEQASGQTAGSGSDVFALGIVLYELATGQHPFKSETMIGYLHAITSQCPPSLTSIKSDLPVALDDLILRMLEKEANSRPTASEVTQALQEIEKYGSSNTLPLRIVAEKPNVSSNDEGFWVAVLPLKYRGNNADLEALAEGLSEDIITGLSRFSCLRVIARGSTLRFTSENADVRSIGKQLGARYVMEGSLRQAGSLMRLVVQLVDATSGAHLWAETYDRTVDAEKLFALQDELVPRIVSTVADWYGVLTHSMSEAVRLKPIDQVTPYEAVLRSFGYYERVTAEEHAAARSALERAVEQAPGNADGWAMLAMMYGEEFRFGFNEQPDAMGRSLRAARRAVDIAPSNHFAYLALAQARFFRKEFDAFRHAAERAIALNPMDGSTMEYVSHLIAFSGDWDYGCEVAERARQLNPNHPGWYWAAPFYNAYRNGDYPTARAFALKIDQPTVDLCQVMLAAVYGQLGEHEAADRTVQTLLSLTPDPAVTRKQLDKWYQPELVEKLIDGLRKAGLNIDEQAAPTLSRPPSTEVRSGDGFWVAVLPFKFTGSNAEVATLADGLTEEIVTGLSRFSYLRVISRSSTARFATETSDIRTIGRTLGARYVMEGSLRLAGSLLRLSVQLVDATSGAHLWAKTYDRPFRSEEIFALQDEIVPQIVSTVADAYGVLPRSMSQVVRSKDPNELTPYEALLRSFSYVERVSIEEHAAAKAALERAVEQAPGDANCWAMLSILLTDEHIHSFNPQPDSLERALQAARRAVDADTSNHRSYQALAWALYFRKEFQASRVAAEHAISLNPMDASNTAYMGQTIAFGGHWERGCSLITEAMQLNPSHPGWYWYASFLDAYRKGDYRDALAIALKINMPGLSLGFVALASAYGQLGEFAPGSDAVRELLALRPDFVDNARKELRKIWNAELVEHLIDGLRKAGLEIIDEEHVSLSPSLASSETRADEGFWVAVLPFKFSGSNAEVATLAEGLSEEIVTGLSRFSYLRVIARSSTLRYAKETDDVRDVGKTLGARYVMAGSLRIAGSSLRISAQLVDASTGAHLWAETYDRQFRAEEVFALQDNLVPRIVSTIADVNGVLPRSMSEAVCSRNPDELSPYEAVLRSFRYFDRVTAEELAAARSCLEIAVQKAPTNADAWAMLALLFVQDYGQGFNLQSDALNSGILAAQRAVEAGPSNHLAYFSLAQARFFQKDFQSFRNAAERAVALNPMDANSLAFMGELLTYAGDSNRGLELATRAKEINPNHPGWFWYADFFNAYRQDDYHGALALILKANLPGHWGMHAGIAAANGQLGNIEAASKAVRDLLKLRPDYGATMHSTLAKWFDPELCEQLLDGLRKAGLEIAGEQLSDKLQFVATPDSKAALSADDKLKVVGHFPSIAVLPFVNISNEPENEYFCDGLAEELLNALSQIESLQVAARTSAFYFKGKQADISEIGSRLNVSSLLEGSVRKSGNRVRISVQLVSVTDGYHLWSEKYDREMKDIFDIQDEIALAVVDALKLKLFGDAKEAVVKRYTDDAEVHELFLKGRYYSYKYTAEGWTRAVEFFEKVIEKQPNHAPAYAGKAAALGCLWFFGLSPADEAVPSFRSAASKAIELDGSLAGAHLSLGMVNFFHDWEWERAEQEFKQALLLNPKDAEALSYYALFLGFVDRFDEAMALASRALEVDPLSLLINMNVGWTWFAAGLANEALDQARKITEIESGFFGAYWLKGATCLGNGDYEEAIEQLAKAVSLGGHPIVLADLGAAYALAGKKETAEAILAQLLDMRRQSYVPAICLARVYSRLGELEKTIQWLETAFEERNGELVFLESEITNAAQGDSLNSLGKDPRVKDLLERMKLPSRDPRSVNEQFS